MTETLESRLIAFALGEVVVPADLAIQLNGGVGSEGFSLLGIDPTGVLPSGHETMGPAALAEVVGRLVFDELAGAVETDLRELVVPTLASVFALKPSQGVAVEALSVGLESAVRLAGGLRARANRDWWDIEAIAGSVGATLAVSRVCGSTTSAAMSALAAAGLQAPRYPVSEPRLRRMLAGLTAADTVETVMAAQAGISGPEDALTGRRGLLAVLAGITDAREVVQGLGERWRITGLLESTFGRNSPPAPTNNKVQPE